jgi:hypothetical protein
MHARCWHYRAHPRARTRAHRMHGDHNIAPHRGHTQACARVCVGLPVPLPPSQRASIHAVRAIVCVCGTLRAQPASPICEECGIAARPHGGICVIPAGHRLHPCVHSSR